VRLNSLTHGLRAEDSLLPGEDEQAFGRTPPGIPPPTRPTRSSRALLRRKNAPQFLAQSPHRQN
jgi:hypothetical protein